MTPPPPPQITLEVPPDLEPAYSNFAIIAHSPSEMVLDFAAHLPNSPKARVTARVVMTPLNAKLLLRALADNIGKYETQFGEIQVPPTLAEQLFRPPGK